METKNLMSEIISLCKRRGFIFQSGEIYGGLQGVYDYGPLGVELKNNLKSSWWKSIVYSRDDVEGLDSSILTHKQVLKSSGHEDTFVDPMVDCLKCKARMRADHVVDSKCSECGSKELTEPRQFNLMFKANFGPLQTTDSFVYLRPETAQGIFTNFKNILDTTSRKLPFGIAQIGKAFRNEITTKNFIFRVREFEQMELEFFVMCGTDEKWHDYWVQNRLQWWIDQGLDPEDLKCLAQPQDELAHYAKATVDIMYKFPIGFQELEGVCNRTDFDLKAHSALGAKLCMQGGETPFVIEPSAGLDRGVLAIICQAYHKEQVGESERIVLRLKPHLAPIKAAVIPLAKNNPEIVSHCNQIIAHIRQKCIGRVKYEDVGNIGKAYRRHDEIGTPLCITVDFQTLEDQTVTIRHRDSMNQERVTQAEVGKFIQNFYT